MNKIRSITTTALFLSLTFLAVVALTVAVAPARAQETTAAITGFVTDPSGAAVVGATVTATDTLRGTVWNTTTNEAGSYNFPRVPIGTYALQVKSSGFQTAAHAPFTLILNQIARVDVQMTVGQIAQTVEVSGETPILQTQTAEVSSLIDANTASSLPLGSRNYLQLVLLTPGVTNPNPQTLYTPQTMPGAGRPMINGNREQADEVLLDGLVNTEDNNNEVGFTPSPDAIQDLNIITQNASAEFGNYEGGIISASIKSGTNHFHGDVFEFLRNDALNANSWSAGLTTGGPFIPGSTEPDGAQDKAKVRYNQFGGTIGGPIVRDKLFFFADYEGLRDDVPPSPNQYQIFTSREIAGDFGQLCTDNHGTFSGAGICSGGTGIQLAYPSGPNVGKPIPNNNLAAAGLTINPVAQNFFNLAAYKAALANSVDVTNNTNYTANGSSQFNGDQGDLKIDYNISSNDHIFGRYSQMHINNPSINTFTLGNPGTLNTEPIQNAVVNWTHTFNPALLNEFRIGYSHVVFEQVANNGGLGNIAEQIGITGGNMYAPGLPALVITGMGGTGFGTNDNIQNFHTGTGQLEDNLIISHGRHTIKVGFQYWRERLNYSYPGNFGALGTFNIGGTVGGTTPSTGAGQADFWLGLVAGGGRDAGVAEFGRRGNIFGAFAQDDWRVTSTLTVNIGLRFEDHTPFYEIQNRMVNFGLFTGDLEVAGQNGASRALYNNYLGIGDWLPRIGLAWSPAFLGGKTVIRAGYGISSYMEGGGANQLLTFDWPATQASSNTLPTIDQGFTPGTAPCATPYTLSCFTGKNIKVFDPNLRPARVQQWNLTVQHQFSNSLTAQVGYVGQHGTGLYNFIALQQKQLLLPDGSIAKPGEVGTVGSDLFLGNNIVDSNYIGGTFSNAIQSYNSLQAVLQKRMSNGLDGQVAYTFSKCMSDSPGFFGTGAWGGNGSQTSMGLPGWQNIYDGKSDYGPCYFDETHILSAYATYQVPVGRGQKYANNLNPVVNAIVGNWSLSGLVNWHTGNALTTSIGFSDPSGTNGSGGLFANERPDCSGPATYPKQLEGGPGAYFLQWFNPTTFSVPAANTFGTCGVGDLRGPRFSETDISIQKNWLFGEARSLQFRTDFINAFNHPILNFAGGIGAFTVGSGMGQITASQGQRNIQFALKFYF
ncbi:MAG: TonB-dependent receptor [Candidatus Acidiferrales bacterium]